MKKFLLLLAAFIIAPLISAYNHDGYDANHKYPWWLVDYTVMTFRGTFPSQTIKYHETPVISNITPALKTLLKRNPSPIVRVKVNPPGSAENDNIPYYNHIEEELTRIGFQVLDKDAPANSRYDLLIDVSWLRFSDPDMTTTIDCNETKIETIIPTSYYYRGYYFENDTPQPMRFRFKKEKIRSKCFRNRNNVLMEAVKKGDAIIEPLPINNDYSLLNETMLNAFIESDYAKENHNTISAVFKIVMSNGVVGGTIHVGHQDNKLTTIPKAYSSVESVTSRVGGVEHSNSIYGREAGYAEKIVGQLLNPDLMNVLDKNYDNNPRVRESVIIAYKHIISQMISPEKNPYAAQLTAGQDVQISNEQLIENSNGSSSTRGSSGGYGRTYYGNYYRGSYYSGNDFSKTSSKSNTTTTKVEAQWLRCSDFYGYYRPLAKKFANELQKLLE